MKKTLTFMLVLLIAIQVKAQITTSEVKVEQTGNTTSISGNLGIGTTIPSVGNTVRSSEGDIINPMLHLYNNSNNSHPTLHISAENTDEASVLLTETSNNHAYGARMYYEGFGNNFFNIAIGDNGTWTDRFSIYRNGNIGIGTTTPSVGSTVRSSEGDIINPILHLYNNSNNSHPTLHISAENTDEASVLLTETSNNHAYGARMYYEGAGNNFFNIAIGDNGTWTDRFSIYRNGNVGIGTTTPNYMLDVKGSLNANSLYNSGQLQWSDFVFEESYKLPDLIYVEKFIKKNGHLPEIPCESDVIENGYDIGDMDAKLLQKIEELTLYMIDINKQLKSQSQRMELFEQENTELKKEVLKLKLK